MLAQAGFDLVVEPPCITEEPHPGEPPQATVLRLARSKAEAVAGNHPDAIVLGADTLVTLDDCVLGKPHSLTHARAMLRRLAGRTHAVLTGVCLRRLCPAVDMAWVCRTEVRFHELTDSTIARYCRLVDPLDKAGGYAIQERGDMLVAQTTGLVSNVIGLPVEEVLARLADAGVWGVA
jgi:septum formation protein